MKICTAKSDQLRSVEILFKDIVTPLPYYNAIAKSSEFLKYTTDELQKKISSDPLSVLIAEEGDQIIGFCFSRVDDMTIWIEWFGVTESVRHKGVARNLIRYLELSAHDRNAHKIWCDCRTENKKSISLLSSCEYEPVCTLKNHWYNQDFIIWQKQLV